MWEALEVAQAADFVRAMPGGLEARIEQGGTNVSGGQRQRLSIARALVRKPSIYVFDDSFSALDLTTDARLRAALKPYTAEAAVVIVAQRVSTIATADDILVLEDGAPRRPRHPRGPARELPHLRRDRPVPDRRAERRMSTVDERTDDREPTTTTPKVDLAAPDTRAAGRWNSAGMPTERSDQFGAGRPPPLVACSRPERPDPRARRSSPRSSAPFLNVLGPAGARLGHRRDHRRAPEPGRASTSAGSTAGADARHRPLRRLGRALDRAPRG